MLTVCLADCPNPKAIGSKVIDIDFRKGKGDGTIRPLEGTTLKYDSTLGAVYSISKDTEAPTVQTDKYIFFGQVDVTVRAASGKGIVTSIVLQSDDLDEIDWEWVGGDNTQVQTNYFSKGCTETYDRGGFTPVSNPINEFHTYTLKWTPERLDWIIDGTVVRTLMASGAKGCSGYPQSPMQVKLGTWVAGRKSAAQGTIEWAGGLADFSKGPSLGYYQSIRIQDFMGGQGAKEATQYVYTDRSGTWESIKVVNGGKDSDEDSSSSSGSTTKTGTSSAATTLATVSSTLSSSNATATFGSSAGGSSSGSSTTSSSAPAISTAAAGKVVLGNAAVVGAAALLGSLVL